ncbi:MAG: hypothetical protein UV51_C0007G0034 [Candidatus Woesebacteria bacterium GW2011_GWC1_42_9]|nr:MAG: hypothetical protein UV51_C0007G0034 [Candidatus Woesebacteria bacterium GW2011_GWC1_42_9]
MDNKQFFQLAYESNRNQWLSFGGMKVSPLTNIPNKNSDAAAWKLWHETLKDNFGKKQANALFLKAWNKQSGSGVSTIALRKYLSENGIDIDKGILDSALDSGSGLLDDFGNMLQIGKYAVYAIGGITIIGFGMLVYNVMKNPIAAAKAGAAFTPAGAAASMAK